MPDRILCSNPNKGENYRFLKIFRILLKIKRKHVRRAIITLVIISRPGVLRRLAVFIVTQTEDVEGRVV